MARLETFFSQTGKKETRTHTQNAAGHGDYEAIWVDASPQSVSGDVTPMSWPQSDKGLQGVCPPTGAIINSCLSQFLFSICLIISLFLYSTLSGKCSSQSLSFLTRFIHLHFILLLTLRSRHLLFFLKITPSNGCPNTVILSDT